MHCFARHDVHLWRVDLDRAGVDARWLAGVLSDDESRRAFRYRFDRHRCEFVHARSALRHVLAGYTGEHPAALRFRYNRYGKPALDSSLEFNLSHAGAVALIAVSQAQVGVDVERVDPEFAWQQIAAQFLSKTERNAITGCSQSDRAEAFFRCWTRREAFLKARGSGWSESALNFDPSLVLKQDDCSWWIRMLDPCSGYVAAVASPIPQFRMKLCDWQPEWVTRIPA